MDNVRLSRWAGHCARGLNGWSFDGSSSWTRVENGESSLSEDYATTVNIDDAITWAERAGNDSPWLLWVALNAPHAPFTEPPDGLHSVNLDGLDPEARPRPPLPSHGGGSRC